MIQVRNVLLSDDIVEELFICDINKCKGACCVEGDLGAPLEKEELKEVEDAYEKVKPYLNEEGIKAIENVGKYILDEEGDFSTPTVHGKECAYAVYDKSGILQCAFELAHKNRKSDFRKPISCHLYPIRIKKYDDFDAANYDRWDICRSGCRLGTAKGVPVYKFLKDALIRKYGKDWYKELEDVIEKNKKAALS